MCSKTNRNESYLLHKFICSRRSATIYSNKALPFNICTGKFQSKIHPFQKCPCTTQFDIDVKIQPRYNLYITKLEILSFPIARFLGTSSPHPAPVSLYSQTTCMRALLFHPISAIFQLLTPPDCGQLGAVNVNY